ncbi:hypothetical protein BC833DRAFT_611463 [Globomyces pollinis-pini]|nr:hypothetical protein BC833DRAFT_611463 [Globomyces pollinis-pini]
MKIIYCLIALMYSTVAKKVDDNVSLVKEKSPEDAITDSPQETNWNPLEKDILPKPRKKPLDFIGVDGIFGHLVEDNLSLNKESVVDDEVAMVVRYQDPSLNPPVQGPVQPPNWNPVEKEILSKPRKKPLDFIGVNGIFGHIRD